MIAQFILSILLAGIVVYAWSEYARSPVVAVLTLLVASAGLYFVWMPEHSTQLAEAVGIGRGDGMTRDEEVAMDTRGNTGTMVDGVELLTSQHRDVEQLWCNGLYGALHPLLPGLLNQFNLASIAIACEHLRVIDAHFADVVG